jgi:predicted DNA-binding transcriptional regulator AlpA
MEVIERQKSSRAMKAQPLEAVNVPGILLNRETVVQVVGLALATINRRIAMRTFPPRYKDGRWLSDHVKAWIDGTWRPLDQ